MADDLMKVMAVADDEDEEKQENKEVEVDFGMSKILMTIQDKMRNMDEDVYACVRCIYQLYGDAIYKLCSQRAEYRLKPSKVDDIEKIEFCIQQILLSICKTIDVINNDMIETFKKPRKASKSTTRRSSIRNKPAKSDKDNEKDKDQNVFESKNLISQVEQAADSIKNYDKITKKNGFNEYDDCNSTIRQRYIPSKFILCEKKEAATSCGPSSAIFEDLSMKNFIHIFRIVLDENFNFKHLEREFTLDDLNVKPDSTCDVTTTIKSNIVKKVFKTGNREEKSIYTMKYCRNYNLTTYTDFEMYYEPSVEFILRNYFVQHNKKLHLNPKSFIIFREVNQIATKKNGKKEERHFVEPVYCYLATVQGKNDIAYSVSHEEKYRIVAYFISKDAADKKMIRCATLPCDWPIKFMSEVVTEMRNNESFIACKDTREMRDRNICIKLKKKEGTTDVIESQKEYQTILTLTQRLSNFALIIEKEANYIRYKFETGGTASEDKKRKGSTSRKSTAKSPQHYKEKLASNDTSKAVKNLTYTEAKQELNISGIIAKKTLKFTVGKEETTVVEELYEPDLKVIVKHFTKNFEKLDPIISGVNFMVVAQNISPQLVKTEHNIRYNVKFEDHRMITKSTRVPEYKPISKSDRAAICKIKGLFQLINDGQKIKYSPIMADTIAKYLNDKFICDKVILKNVLIDKFLGIMDENEIKNNYMKDQTSSKSMFMNTLFPSDIKRIPEKIPDNEINVKTIKNFTIEETFLKRTLTNKLPCLFDGKEYYLEIEEPNLITCMLMNCIVNKRLEMFPNEMKKFEEYEDLNSHIDGTPSYPTHVIINEDYNEYSEHDKKCPYRKHGSFIIISKKKLYSISTDLKEEVYEELHEPKVVRMFCKDCSNYLYREYAADSFMSWCSFTRTTQILDYIDLLYTLRQLAADCEYAHNERAHEMAYENYKQRIQRFMATIKKSGK